jgi:hypothetical protein
MVANKILIPTYFLSSSSNIGCFLSRIQFRPKIEDPKYWLNRMKLNILDLGGILSYSINVYKVIESTGFTKSSARNVL